MFGLLHSLFVGGAFIASKVRDGVYDVKSNNKAINEGRETYLDFQGNERLSSNGKKCYHTIDPKTNDYILCDMNGNTIKNYTRERKEKEIRNAKEKAVENNRTVYEICDFNSWSSGKTHNSHYYIDLKTHEILYFYNMHNNYSYYVDKNNQYLVRPSDTMFNYMKNSDNPEKLYKDAIKKMDDINKKKKDIYERLKIIDKNNNLERER